MEQTVKGYADKLIKPLNDYWTGMSKEKRKKTIITSIVVFVAVCILAIVLTTKQYDIMYTDLSSKDAGEIVARLDTLKVPYKTAGDGTIYVEKSQVSKTKMLLASEGLPKTTNPYEMYLTNTSGLGVTESDKQRIWQVAMEQNLQDTIATIEQVEWAKVKLSIPEGTYSAIRTNKQEPKASVVLGLRSSLTQNQVDTIQDLVAKSVLDLTPDNVSIADDKSNQLTKSASEVGSVGDFLEYQRRMQDLLQEDILKHLEPVFGEGRVSPAVSVKLNNDKTARQSTIITPTPTPISTEESGSKSSESATGGAVGLDPNGGLPTEYIDGSGSSGGEYIDWTKIANYEVSSIIENVEQAQGSVEDITVSVIIDNNRDMMFMPTVEEVGEIVAKTLGISVAKVTISYLPFAINQAVVPTPINTPQQVFAQKVLLYGGIALAILFIMLIAYFVVNNRKYDMAVQNYRTVPAPVVTADSLAVTDSLFGEADEFNAELLQGSSSDYYKGQIQQYIQKDPSMAVQLLRAWIGEN